jgi:hypothetical protein
MAALMRTTRFSMGIRMAQDLLSSGGMRQEGPTSNCTSKANLTNVGPMARLRRCLPHLFNAADFRLGPPRGAYAKEDLHLYQFRSTVKLKLEAPRSQAQPTTPFTIQNRPKLAPISIGICSRMCKIAGTSKDIRS